MVTRQDVVDAAREFMGTRWHHQGRNRAGIDCIGLVIAVAHQLGLSDYDTTGYGRIPDGRVLCKLLDQHMQRTDNSNLGDVLLMRFEKNPQHVAIVTDIGIIHAYANARRVVEHRLDAVWAARVVGSYRFKGIA